MLTGLVMTTAFAGLVMNPAALGLEGPPSGLGLWTDPPLARFQRGSAQLTDHDLCVLRFDSRSDGLSEQSLELLQKAWEATRRDATLQEVLVAAYGDADYPRAAGERLPRGERLLAEHRGGIVRRYLLDLGARHVAVYNMAKKPNWLQDWLLTADAQIKREVVGYSLDLGPVDLFYQEVGQYLEAEGGPGKVFVIMHKDLLYAH